MLVISSLEQSQVNSLDHCGFLLALVSVTQEYPLQALSRRNGFRKIQKLSNLVWQCESALGAGLLV